MFIFEHINWTILILAFATGMVHALDADHIMAVSAISAQRGGAKAIVRLCLNWALGHGATLLFFGVFIILLGFSIPHRLSHYAEIGVAIILITIGFVVLRELFQAKAHLHFHRHDNLGPHAHWHTHAENKGAEKKFLIHESTKFSHHSYTHTHEQHQNHNHHHRAMLVGVVHGLAGLAPLLAVLPLANQPAWLGIVYIFVFSLGVFLAMMIFGGVFSRLLNGLQRYGVLSMNLMRGMIATGSISIGIFWLVTALR